jgi:hypothetical protein
MWPSSKSVAESLALLRFPSRLGPDNQLKNLGLVDSRERERLLGNDLRRGELFEFSERFAVELDPPSVPPVYARAVVSANRKGQLTAARTVELLQPFARRSRASGAGCHVIG